jgi:mRNA interferase RelE/StbE
MSYELAFLDDALREWRKLDAVTREQFKAKLAERLANPKIPSARLHGAKERYKIKLRSAGFRLVYEVRDAELLVLVVAVGKRDRNAVYRAAAGRGGE